MSTAKINVVVNNAEAKARIGELRNELDKLRKARREALTAGNNELANGISKEISSVNKEVKELTVKSVEVEAVLRNINKVPLSQLHAAQRKLRSELQGLDRDSFKYHETQKSLVRVEKELNSARGTSISTLGKLSALIGGGFALSKLYSLGEKAVNSYAQLDDKMADVMKTTGLTKDQVIALDAALMKLDTRTSREGRLDLARIGGKLGINDQAEIEGFVRAADKIKVALAEDLGGDAEEAIRQLGKLVDIFDLKPDMGLEKALISVGSSINALGASSTANEAFLVDFANRAAGIAPNVGVSIPKILGLGATLDSLGQTAEVSGTVYSQVMTKMQTDTAKYAELAGMDVKAFTKLFKEDANEAFLKFLEGVGQGDDVAKKLAGLGLEGARATTILSVLASNTDKIREQQALANDEFIKGTSIINEYNTKNQSAQAILEKKKVAMDAITQEMGQRLMPVWSSYLGLQGSVLKGLMALVDVMWKHKGVIVSVGAAIIFNIGIRKAKVAIQQLEAFWSQKNRKALAEESVALAGATTKTYALSAAKNLLAGNFKAGAMAAKAFFVSLGPLGWATIAIAAIGGAISKLGEKTTNLIKSQQDITKINTAATDSYAKEKVSLEQLLAVASDKSTSDKDRKSAMLELQSKIPDGINLINEETIANGKAKKAVDDYCESLLRRAKIEAAKDYLVEMEKERLKAIEEGSDKELSIWQKSGVLILSSVGAQTTAYKKVFRNAEQNGAEYEASFGARMERIKAHIKELDLPEKKKATTDTPDYSDDTKGKWSLNNDEAFIAKRLKLREGLFSGEIATEEEYSQRLLALEIETLQRRIDMQLKSGTALLSTQEQLAEKRYQQAKDERTRQEKLIAASTEGKESGNLQRQYDKEALDFESRLKSLGLFHKSRADMTEQEFSALLNQERIYSSKLSGIYSDSLIKQFKKQSDASKREIDRIKIKHNQELADATTFEQKRSLIAQYYGSERANLVKNEKDADRQLRAYYNQVETQEAKAHLEGLLKDYTSVMQRLSGDTMDVDGVSIKFSEEELAVFQSIIDKLNTDLGNLRSGGSASTVPVEDKVDILGYSSTDWEQFFTNLKDGEMSIENWQMALGLVGQAFGEINKLMAAASQREIKEHEKTAKYKKKKLDDELRLGLISEEDHQKRTQELDEQTEAKRVEITRKEAARTKALSIFEAMINTAVAIVSALKAGPIIGPILAGAIGALGAIQIAAIAATPVPGQEDGGYLGVVREQDGKHYNAKYDPDKRGYIDSATVLVGEQGREYVIPNEGLTNPTFAPMLDIIERSRKNNTLGSLNFPEALAATVQGRATGGYVEDSPDTPLPTPPIADSDENSSELLRMLNMLYGILSEGIDARVVMLGRDGLWNKFKQHEKQINKSKK